MKNDDKEFCIRRYTQRYKQHGYSPLSLGWGVNGKQDVRFKILSEIGLAENHSVLDIGCGFGDLKKYLNNRGWQGKYLGLDIVEPLLIEAKKQHPEIAVQKVDILNDVFTDKFDVVVASGIFNAKMKSQDNYSYIEEMLSKMFDLCAIGVAVDFLSSYVDFEAELNFHSDPSVILKIAKNITKRVTLRHDYMPYEFALYLYKNDDIDSVQHTFIDK